MRHPKAAIREMTRMREETRPTNPRRKSRHGRSPKTRRRWLRRSSRRPRDRNRGAAGGSLVPKANTAAIGTARSARTLARLVHRHAVRRPRRSARCAARTPATWERCAATRAAGHVFRSAAVVRRSRAPVSTFRRVSRAECGLATSERCVATRAAAFAHCPARHAAAPRAREARLNVKRPRVVPRPRSAIVASA